MIKLNIGGQIYVSSNETLSRSPFFVGLLRSDPLAEVHCVDRDPTFFRWILNFMRGSSVVPTEKNIYDQVKFEADFYCINIPEYNHYQGLEFELQKISSRI